MSDIGLNFRGSGPYVTDGANETYVLGEVYPTTRGGVTFGWDIATIFPVDRNTFFDRRIDGINFDNSGGTGIFQVDLPSSGTWVIHTALGDAFGGGSATNTCTVKDNTTTLVAIPFIANVGNQFTDATGVQLSEVTWPTTEAGLTKVFATTTCKFVMTSAGFWTIAHVRLFQTVAAGQTARPIIDITAGSWTGVLG